MCDALCILMSMIIALRTSAIDCELASNLETLQCECVCMHANFAMQNVVQNVTSWTEKSWGLIANETFYFPKAKFIIS